MKMSILDGVEESSLQLVVKSSSSSSNGSSVCSCEDLLIEILCRLPVRNLIRFKCVSKLWRFLISTICIPRITSIAHPPPLGGLYFRSFRVSGDLGNVLRDGNRPFTRHFLGEDVPILNGKQQVLQYAYVGEDYICGSNGGDSDAGTDFGYLPFLPFADDFLDSCNGLLLFVDAPTSWYYVCNPATRQHVRIPKADCHRCCLYAALAFYPPESPCYKIVRFDELALDIYSSDTGTWIRHSLELDSHMRECMKLMIRHSVYFKGALYRLSTSRHLMRFGVDEVSAHEIKLPRIESPCEGLVGCVGVLMGCLCYANKNSSRVLVWSLEDHRNPETWILTYGISMPDLTRDLVLSDENVHLEISWIGPCGFHPSADVIFVGTPFMIMSYDLKINRLQEVCRTRDGTIMPGCFYPAFTYVSFPVPFDNAGNINCRAISLVTDSKGARILSSEMPSNASKVIQIDTRVFRILSDCAIDISSNDASKRDVSVQLNHISVSPLSFYISRECLLSLLRNRPQILNNMRILSWTRRNMQPSNPKRRVKGLWEDCGECPRCAQAGLGSPALLKKKRIGEVISFKQPIVLGQV